jgi:manganese transport protein
MSASTENLPSSHFEGPGRTVKIPAHWWRRLLAFAGPAYMVAVGYMDPGNWATDLAGGSLFGYRLLWVLLLSNAMAVLLQTLSARLGLVSGRDLAQACRSEYPPPVRIALFVLCEIAIAATDLAEVLGSAVGLNLLLGVPLAPAVLITGGDVLLLLVIQRLGIRRMEAFIVMLIALIGACFLVEIFLCRPDWTGPEGALRGLAPGPLGGQALYVAIGIIGATIMPHNLYLHSSLVQSRDVQRSRLSVKQACRFNLIDSLVAMNGAFLINAAILIVAAATFYGQAQVTELQQAYHLLGKLLPSPRIAQVAFALALLAAGQSSTVTGTLAGQITMEGFLNFRMRPWLRRLVTRLLAIVPAMAVILSVGQAGHAVYWLLILSQVVLSLQLPFAVVPLVKFTSSRIKMGPFANPRWVKALAWVVTGIIVSLNTQLVVQQVGHWGETLGPWRWGLYVGICPLLGVLMGLLLWMILRPERAAQPAPIVTAQQVLEGGAGGAPPFRRIGVALQATRDDAGILAQAIALAKANRCELVLLHVVEGVGGQWYGPQTGDLESRQDQFYLDELAGRLGKELAGQTAGVRAVLGYGDVTRALAVMTQREGVDLLVVGSHGHRGLGDVIHGATISGLRHAVNVPVFAVRKKN